MQLNKFIDHTLLKPTATPAEIKILCEEAKTYNFYAVCVNGCNVSLASTLLKNSAVKIVSVIGFPLGTMSTKAKIAEALDCIKNGAHEIDMVINLGWLKAGHLKAVLEEIYLIKKAIGKLILKVIIETCYLEDDEKRAACITIMNAGADFVKTSTGFGTSGATLQDVILIKEAVGNKIQIKASGGIKDSITALEYINLGVSRLGTSSGVKIIEMEKD